MARALIGTSGWHYDSWRGQFFPKGLPIKNQLQYYASQFSTTELNGVFYRTPTPDAVKSWREQTGNDFVFAWKASKFITHWKRLSQNSVNSLSCLKIACRYSARRPDQFCFSCRRIFRPTPTGLSHSSSCFRTNAATVSNSGIQVGMPRTFLSC